MSDDTQATENTETTRVEVTETNTHQPADNGDENQLGDAGKRALEAERKARKEAERRIAESEKQLEDARKRIEGFEDANRSEVEKREHQLKKAEEKLEQVRKERDNLNRQLLVTRIASEYGLPSDIAGRLQGDNEDELRDDAEKLKALVAPTQPRAPWPVLQEGANSGKSRTTQQVFEDALRPFLS